MRPPVAAAVSALLVGGLVVGALPVVGTPLSHAAAATAEGPDGLSANVTWDGANVDRANSALDAFVLGAGQSAQVSIAYTGASPSDPVVNATLSLQYVRVVLSSESIVPTAVGPNGSAVLNWTFGSLIYLTEGAYALDAELLDANGSVLYHQAFYVTARAPYVVGSAIFAMALLLAVVELVWIRTVIRHRTRGRRRSRG